MHPLLAALRQKPLLADGGMGALLLSQGAVLEQCLEELSLSRPDWIRDIQLAYAKAGADILLTHTFGAHEHQLGTYGLAHKVEEINRAAVRIARDVRETTGKSLFLGGSIGPLGEYLTPHGPVTPDRARSVFARQAAALLEGGIDFFCIETMSDLQELELAIRAVRDLSDLPILGSMTFGEDGQSQFGVDAATAMRSLLALDIELVGVNCSVGPAHVLKAMDTYHRTSPGTLLSAMPNAGLPTRVDGRFIYASGPEYFASMVPEFLAAGAVIIGGCCGTTPAHIQAMRQALDTHLAGASGQNGTLQVQEQDEVLGHRFQVPNLEQEDGELPDSRLLQKIRSGKFVVSVEVDPPRGMNPAKQIAGARLARERGADAINVADSPMARVRMSALVLSALIQQQVGIDTILHFTTRDRSLMGLQADLLGAHALGVKNILALTGDPPSLGDMQTSTPVYDVDSIGLVRILHQFNQGLDLLGKTMGQQSNFTVSVACDPTRPDLEEEATRLSRKLVHGAHFIMTQPIYDPVVWTTFTRIYERLHGPIPAPVLIGILPLQSFRHASFLHNEVPGITLTADALARMKQAGKKGRQAGVQMAQELLLQLMDAPYVQGVYLMPSFGRYETACQVLDVVQDTHTVPTPGGTQ